MGTSVTAGSLLTLGLSTAGKCEGLAALACGLAWMSTVLVGTVVGTVTGAIRGHRDVYRFPATVQSASASCRPPQSSSPPDS